MYFFSSVPFLRILPAFCVGIIFYHYDFVFPQRITVITAIVSCIILFFRIRQERMFKLRYVFGIYIQLVFFTSGYFLTVAKDDRNSENYFAHVKNPELYFAEIISSPVIKNENCRVTARINSIGVKSEWKEVTGDCYIYIKNDNEALKLTPGREIIFSASMFEIAPPKNPGQFNFRRYSALHRIHYQFYPKKNSWKLLPENDRFSLKSFAHTLREQFLGVYKSAGLSGNEYAVLSALVLGYDDEIDNRTMKAFSATGTLHILSVSGMHVGLLFSALSALLVFLERRKSTRIFRLIFLILALWFYALLTGLSPSVIRSAMMFTFILIGRSMNRNSNIFNTLGLTALCIFLLFDPILFFDIGMQLSFLAVGGIVFLYPKIYRLINFRNFILDKSWGLTAVSISAQLTTFAISIYYFHQFPNYFILANLLIIPLSTLAIFGGVILLCFQFFEAATDLFGYVLNILIFLLNYIADFIASLPGAVWNGLTFNLVEVILFYLILILIVVWKEKKLVVYFIMLLASVLFLITSFSVNTLLQLNSKKLIVYSGTNHFCGHFIFGLDSWLFCNSSDSLKAFQLSNDFCNSSGIPVDRRTIIFLDKQLSGGKHFGVYSNRNFILFGGFKVLIVDSLTPEYYRKVDWNPDLLYLEKKFFTKSSEVYIPAQQVIYDGKKKNLFYPAKNGKLNPAYWDIRNGARIINL